MSTEKRNISTSTENVTDEMKAGMELKDETMETVSGGYVSPTVIERARIRIGPITTTSRDTNALDVKISKIDFGGVQKSKIDCTDLPKQE